jgi:glycosyltransferase involved in cell wall biosynthesis
MTSTSCPRCDKRDKKKLVLIMRNQKQSSCDALVNPELYPGEWFWGFRPLTQMLGAERVKIIYVNKSGRGIWFARWSTLTSRLFGGLRVNLHIFSQLWSLRQELDAVFISENVAFFTAILFKMFFLTSIRIYPVVLGWVEFKFSFMPKWMYQLWIYLFLQCDGIACPGYEEANALESIGIERVRHLSVGVDPEFWNYHRSEIGEYIFTVGADPCRDYSTLVQAAGELPLLICAPEKAVSHLDLRDNITVVTGTLLHVRDWIKNARLVVFTLKDVLRPSAQVSMLQCMSMGKAVIITKTKGTWSRHLVDGENCVFVPPNDAFKLQSTIRKLYYDMDSLKRIGKCARETTRKHYTDKSFAESIAEITNVSRE